MKRLLTAILLAVFLLGMAASAMALTHASFSFGTWTGSGDISVTIDGDPSIFATLIYDYYYNSKVEVDPSNYVVSGMDNSTSGGGTIITLKQEYLETLANGDHLFTAAFSADDLYLDIVELTMQTETEAIATVQNFSWLPDLSFWQLKYGDEDVDASFYTVTATDITPDLLYKTYLYAFNEDYIAGLSGEHSFSAYYSRNSDYIDLSLIVDVSVTATPPPTPSPTPKDTPTILAPQTDDRYDPLAWTFVMIASMLGVCALLVWRKKASSCAAIPRDMNPEG